MNPDLQAAVERLQIAASMSAGAMKAVTIDGLHDLHVDQVEVYASDLRLVLDALKDAEQDRRVIRRFLRCASASIAEASSNIHEALGQVEPETHQ